MRIAKDLPYSTAFENEQLIPENLYYDSASDTDSSRSVPVLTMQIQNDDESISTGRLVVLTIWAIGLQTIWSVVMSHGTPYFTHIGISPAGISLIWMASPITSALFQPYIGAVSDGSRHPWGRRKFYIVIGTASTILSILILRQSIIIAVWLAHVFGAEPQGEVVRTTTQVIAIVGMILFSFATCPLQASLRAFTVEHCPRHQQGEATAWVCRPIAVFVFVITADIHPQIYSIPILSLNQRYTVTERDAIIDQGTQVGSLAMFTFAVVGLIGNILLPFFVCAPSKILAAQESTRLRTITKLFKLPCLTLTHAWMLSLLLLGTCMLAMAVTTHSCVGIMLGGLMGVSWAMTQWAPLSIISTDLFTREVKDPELGQWTREEETGTVMGIYNTAIAAPQVLAALGSAIIFGILNVIGITDQMRWVLGTAGLPAFVAAWLASKL
ncbi:hypothetical protein B7463_g7361, partial [Scytalidium lignicola]